MDKLSSLNLSFDKILIQVVIPGLIAIFPYFLLYLHFHPLAKEYLYKNQSITLTTVTFLSLIAGMLIENFGGIFEVAYLDKKVAKKHPDFNLPETWDKFLEISYKANEPIGHRYLRNILLRMKFEISTGIALIIMFVGLNILDIVKTIIINKYLAIIILSIIPLSLAAYLLLYEASQSSIILAKTRKILVDKYNKKNLEQEDLETVF